MVKYTHPIWGEVLKSQAVGWQGFLKKSQLLNQNPLRASRSKWLPNQIDSVPLKKQEACVCGRAGGWLPQQPALGLLADKVWVTLVFHEDLHLSNSNQSVRGKWLLWKCELKQVAAVSWPRSFQRGSSLLQRAILGVCTRSWWLGLLCASAWTRTQADFWGGPYIWAQIFIHLVVSHFC